MARLDNIEALEKQLAELQMTMESLENMNNPNKVKKIPPAVPPKKKAQPQVPHSFIVNNLREPSYSTKISTHNHTNNTTYSNLPPDPVHSTHKDYANISPINAPSYSNQIKRNVSTLPKTYTAAYGNVSPYHNNDDMPLPPPPPPPPLPIANAFQYNNVTEEYLPPPSPVSSNYSELVRATSNLNYNQERSTYPPIYQNEFNDYGPPHTSTYEPLYEPISPQLSRNYTPGSNSIQNYDNESPNQNKSPLPKEQEVDSLTDLLVQSISDSQDLDVFGKCIKCNGKVVGENSGCTAMGNMYHVSCFCCYRCNINLQGKPFYAVEGLPYCEVDYYETLEKCSVCEQPILDRIIRATGKPYHPNCFTCVVCGKSLDGIPFTVDAMNQIHCIEDFHKKFAPRCCVCELPIMPEEGEEETVRVVALDRSFHVRCYRCEDCGMLLTSEAEGRGCYPLDGHILCQECNAHRIRLITNVMTTDL